MTTYTGTIRHRRRAAPAREFCHRVTYAYVDVADARDVLGEHDLRALTGTAAGPIRVLAMPRRLGVGFNPVRFYYLFDEDERLDSVVAEVTSTPWGERQTYVVHGGGGPVLMGAHDKRMRVSPFQPMERRHAWRVSEPGETLSVHIANDDDFDATLSLRRSSRRRTTSPLRALALIYAHALVLKLRGARYYR
jgi:DUF1365 family protein